MANIRAPGRRQLTPIQLKPPRDFTSEIMAVQSQNPLAEAITQVGNVAGSAIKRRGDLARVMALGSQLGLSPEQSKGLTPEDEPALRTLALNRTLPKTEEQQADLLSKKADIYSKMFPQATNQVVQGFAGPHGLPITIPTKGTAIPTEIGGTGTTEDPMAKTMREELMGSFKKLYGIPTPAPAPSSTPSVPALPSIPLPESPSPIKLTKVEGGKEETRQDKLEAQARQGIISLRGDKALQDIETKRDNSISAYNTIAQIKKQGRTPTRLELYDIVGQMQPGISHQEAMNLVDKTFKGDLSRMATYLTGQTAGATTEDILNNLQEVVKSNGLQADDLHEGYMQVHGQEVFPSGLNPEQYKRYSKLARGRSFSEATGLNKLKTLPTPGGSPKPGGVLHSDAKGNKAWVYPDGTFDEVK